MSQNQKKNNEETIWNYLWSYVSGNEKTEPVKTRSRRTQRKVSKATISKLTETTWISALQLSLWDNISGPKVEIVWLGTETIDEDVQIYIARHTLDAPQGEPPDPQTRFHACEGLGTEGYIMVSIVYYGHYAGQSSQKLSLTMLLSAKYLTRYTLLHYIIEDRLKQLVGKLKELCEHTQESAATTFTKQLPAFEKNLNDIFYSSLPNFSFEETLFQDEKYSHNSFLPRVITSHLQTHGSTVVIGKEIEVVNSFIKSLAIFLSPNERERSSLAKEGQPYVPDLVLQGVLGFFLEKVQTIFVPLRVNNLYNLIKKKKKENVKILDEKVIEAMLPTTLINIDERVVQQTHPCHEYNVLRTEFIKLETERLVTTTKKENLWTAQEGLFKPLKNPSTWIEKMLDELFKLPVHIREAYLLQFFQLLVKKAIILIKYVEKELQMIQDPKSNDILETQTVKKIRLDLGLNHDADFFLLLGLTEKLKPRTYVALAGDPQIIEEKFIELFESF